MVANINFNNIEHAAENPIDEVFYENRGRSRTVSKVEGDLVVNDINRVQIYNASYTWYAKDFDLRGFYRKGHYHWGYEGDFLVYIHNQTMFPQTMLIDYVRVYKNSSN
ncbi:hypothetical protein [Flavobacterium sp. ACAM 123]|jgi:hypothetical protein|uniref:hypothetical protein n=1 Tax=Flavobacterium sp. ACAM 123 TaxID=1189620 RepID=UPI0002E73DB1|nr:hypothetical protein [Flavobacterium sp. ACAM 123]